MSTPPLIIVGHGTRRTAGVDAFLALVQRVQRRAAGEPAAVAGGMIELAEPSVATGVARLLGHPAASPATPPAIPSARRAAAAAPEVVAVPLMLGTAGHVRSDIPALLRAEQGAHPGLRFRYARPLGPHLVLDCLLAARVDAALHGDRPGSSGHAGPAPADTRIVLVGRGCSDADANAAVAAVARRLRDGHGYRAVEVAFVAVAGPSVPQALHRLRRAGATHIVVAPYLLFPGVLAEQVAAETRAFAADHSELDVRLAGLLGDCDEIADLVLERYRQALGVQRLAERITD